MTYILHRRTLCAALIGTLVASPARAQEGGSTGDPLSLDLTGVVLPIANGQTLVTYLFCAILVQFRDVASALYFRENQYLLRDALVRIASRSPVPVGATPNTYDRVAITRLVLRAVQAIRPAAQVVRVTVTQGDFMRR